MIKKKKSPKEKSKGTNIQSFMQAVQLPVGALPNCAHIEMNGNREVILEGCHSILQYEEDKVKISTGKMILEFCGRNLNIKCLTAESLIIEGFILSINFKI